MVTKLLHLLIHLLSTIAYASALNLQGTIRWNDICQGINDLGQAEVVLDNRAYGTVTRNGNFTIFDVAAGTYLLSVSSHDFSFDQLRVDVMTSDTQPEIRPYVSGTPLHPPSQVLLQYPIVLAARQRHGYFLVRESFSMFTMFSNPMMLFMVFGVVMMLATPYLIKNMDPESLKELKEQQTKMANMQNAIASGTNFSTLLNPQGGSRPTAAGLPERAANAKGKGNKRRA